MFRFHAPLACGAAITLASPAVAEDLCAKALMALGPRPAAWACAATAIRCW